MAQCKSRTRAKKRCRNKAVDGNGHCRPHAPKEDEQPEVVDPNAPKKGPNEQAVLRKLKAQTQIDENTDPRWQMLLSLAAAVDANPSRASLWTSYREALADLMKDSVGGDSDLEEAEKALRGAS